MEMSDLPLSASGYETVGAESVGCHVWDHSSLGTLRSKLL